MKRARIVNEQRLYLSFLPRVRKHFSDLSGINRIGLGAKQRRGVLLEEWAFRFYVDKKRPLAEISPAERIPGRIFGVQTDVIAQFESTPLVFDASVLSVDEKKYRDDGIRGGISIRNEHFDNDQPSGYGTLGILARRQSDNALVGLTCAHVINAASEAMTTLSTKIGQPKYWLTCCCCPHGYIGDVAKATLNDDLDCAIIDIHDDMLDKITANTTENKIEGIAGDISGAAAIVCFDNIRKRGRSTGVTTGKVSDVAYGDHQMLIERTDGNPGDPFAVHGDSGAVIVNSGNQVVGLLVAADRADMSKAIATHIKPVMLDMGITIAGTDAAIIGEPVGSGASGCELFAWPGGQAESTSNPVETFSSADFGLAGNVDWDVSKGASGAVIVETGTQTASSRDSISVRYDDASATTNPTDTVWISAVQGANAPVTKFRTVFKFTPRVVNTSGTLDAGNTKRFTATGGTDNQAGAGVPGTAGATSFLAKSEVVFDVTPQDLRWSGSGGVSFVTGAPAGTKGNIVARRETRFTRGEQANGAANRTHTDEADWTSAGDSTADDFQEPTDAAPNELFRLANEGFDPANLLQGYLRADYRDFLEFHDGSNWIRITTLAEWFADLTADLSGAGTPPPVVGAVNALGAGASAEKIPNQKPTLTVTNFQEVKLSERVTLSATPADGDNDALTVSWAQTVGPAVALSSPTGNSVTFNAPADDFQFKFTATADDGTGVLSRAAGNHLSDPAEITVNVVEWKNVGGGDPVVGRNMTEDFNAADFGVGAGALNWNVTTGNLSAVIIEADGAAIAATGTHNGASTIKVRYDNNSGDLTRAQTVRIQATHSGSGKSWFKRRTVFRVTVAVHATDAKTHKISSNKGAGGKDHFCTAKGAGNTIFDATLNPAPPAADITWTAIGRAITVPSVGADRTTAHINRGPGAGLSIPIEIEVGGDKVYEGLSWIIWSIGSLYDRVAPAATFSAIQTTLAAEYKFKFVLQPPTIAMVANDIPDLSGANNTNVPNVSAADVSVWNKGQPLAGGANNKWDVSRRLRQKMFNAGNIPKSLALFPTFYTTYNNWPSDDVVGNDDTHVLEAGFPEDNDPYTAPNIGELHAFDKPRITPFNSGANAEGNVGDTIEKRMHFQEFARVELDGHWYVISDPLLWKYQAKCKKASESTDGADYDGDGAQNKELWIDNGSILDGTNSGW